MDNKKVWFVTGASKGLGLSLVKKLLAQGYPVAATSRNRPALEQAVGSGRTGQFLPLEVDLTRDDAVAAALAQTVEAFGRLDVVVNNAGYGTGGTPEELSPEEIAQNFEVNVFATIRVIQKAMPYLRAQRAGHIINVSSIAGFSASTGWALYAASKFAVVGLSEVLAEDVRALGVHVTVVAPGAFRTQFLSDDSLVLARQPIEEYRSVRESHARYRAMNGSQAGDPDKAADVFIELAEHPSPPVRLFLGGDAYRRAVTRIGELTGQLEAWKNVSFSTDFN